MSHWFPSPEIDYEPRAGGRITLGGDPYHPDARTTKVLVWEPPHRFSFEWETDELHFTLSEHDDGCRLELVNLLSTSGAGARNAAGWEMCLGHLDRVVAGTWEPLADGRQHGGVPARAGEVQGPRRPRRRLAAGPACLSARRPTAPRGR